MKCSPRQAVAKPLLVLDVERINEAIVGFSLAGFLMNCQNYKYY